MKYLDVLKEYDKAIVSESKRLDSIYKKLIGESCDCGKEDCPECGKKKELDEGCDKGKIEFDEGDAEGGKQDKKMMPPEEFNKMVSKEEFLGKGKDSEDDTGECNECDPLNGGLHNGHEKVSEGEEEKKEEPPVKEPEEENKPTDGNEGDNGNVDENENIEKEVMEFFGISNNDGDGKNLKEDAAKNQQMDASDIFAEADEGEEKKDEPPAEEPEKKEGEPSAEEQPDKKEDEPSAEEPEKKEEPPTEEPEKKVDENSGKSIKELMGKTGEIAEGEKLSMKEIMAKESSCNECDPLNGGLHNGHENVGEEVDDETKNLNESIQAIRQFVKANRKYFK